jgi:hypothetical protein
MDEIRPELKKFAQFQESVLKSNDYKGGWRNMSLNSLFDDLVKNIDEARETIKGRNAALFRKQITDIANYAMMIFDNINRPDPNGLLSAVKFAYREHYLNDNGNNELADILKDALCDEIGEEEFSNWLEEFE